MAWGPFSTKQSLADSLREVLENDSSRCLWAVYAKPGTVDCNKKSHDAMEFAGMIGLLHGDEANASAEVGFVRHLCKRLSFHDLIHLL